MNRGSLFELPKHDGVARLGFNEAPIHESGKSPDPFPEYSNSAWLQ